MVARLTVAVVLVYCFVPMARADDRADLWRALSERRFADARRMVAAKPALANAVIHHDGGRPLHFAAGTYPDLETVTFLISKGASVHATDRNGIPVIHFAVLAGNEAIVSLLLKKGVSVNNVSDYDGSTPLHSAVKDGDYRMIQFLLARKANINAKDRRGDTPLHDAALLNNKKLCSFLKARGAKLTIENNDGYTPSDVARLNGNPVIADFLRP